VWGSVAGASARSRNGIPARTYREFNVALGSRVPNSFGLPRRAAPLLLNAP
jgi:hypothetical protein